MGSGNKLLGSGILDFGHAACRATPNFISPVERDDPP